MTDVSKDASDEIRFEPETGTYRATYGDPNHISTTVVLAVAEALDADVLSLPPLNDVVDPDALNTLFGPRRDDEPRLGGRVSFVMAGCDVTVRSDGVVVVTPP